MRESLRKLHNVQAVVTEHNIRQMETEVFHAFKLSSRFGWDLDLNSNNAAPGVECRAPSAVAAASAILVPEKLQ